MTRVLRSRFEKMAASWSAWLFLVAGAVASQGSVVDDELLHLDDASLNEALVKHPKLIVNVNTVAPCLACDALADVLKSAAPEIRVKTKDAVKLAEIKIEREDMDNLNNLISGALSLPKLILFREGEPLDYAGESYTKEEIVKTVLYEASRDTVMTLRTVKMAERFLNLDSWSLQHQDEEKKPRAVGFFPSNATAGYRVFYETSLKLQGLVQFAACFNPAIQKKFLGAPAKRSIVQIVKKSTRDRKQEYSGPLAVPLLARWIGTHSVPLVHDLTTEASVESLMSIGQPVFLTLLPDEHEAGDMLPLYRKVAATMREKILFGYGFMETEPWPRYARMLNLPKDAKGALWLMISNGIPPWGRNWSHAWLRQPSLQFSILAAQSIPNGITPKRFKETKVRKFIDSFLEEVAAISPEEDKYDIVQEDDVEAIENEVETGSSSDDSKVVVTDKKVRNQLSALTMTFNSAVANLKKALDDVADSPQLLPGKAPSLIQLVSNMDLKMKKDILQLKRELMELGKSPKEEM